MLIPRPCALLLAALVLRPGRASKPTSSSEPTGLDVAQALLDHGVDISTLPGVDALTKQAASIPRPPACAVACAALSVLYGSDAVDPQNTTAYSAFVSSYWSAIQSDVAPSCVFVPPTPEAVAVLVLLARLTRCPFAVKSGGHAAFAGASSSPGGITLSFERLNAISVSEDRSVVSVQPGNVWRQVYTALEQHDLGAIGGRVSGIGVGGLTLGGGISYFSSLYGWACDNVASYDVVTASGALITASPTQHPDLYWALRGGGNNFGIVVGFNLRTFPLPGGMMWGGDLIYTAGFPQIMDAFATAVRGSPEDPGAGLWLSWGLDPTTNSGTRVAAPALWYHKPISGVEDVALFNGFRNLTAVFDTTQNRTLSNMTDHVQESTPSGFREMYYPITVRAVGPSTDLLSSILDIFWQGVPAVSSLPNATAFMTWQGITEGMLQPMVANGGNPLGLSPQDGPYFLIEVGCQWERESDDAVVAQTFSAMLQEMKKQAVARGVETTFVYMNYASQFQDVVAGYGAENKAGLKRVARTYDPAGVFQTLQPGYFKLDGPPTPGTGLFSF